MCVCLREGVCVCERECVCVCVHVRVCVCVCVCVCAHCCNVEVLNACFVFFFYCIYSVQLSMVYLEKYCTSKITISINVVVFIIVTTSSSTTAMTVIPCNRNSAFFKVNFFFFGSIS